MPKRSHLFSEKLKELDISGVNIKPLCPTRWTARTGAIQAILQDYTVLIDTLDEIHQTTRDEYAAGLLSTMEKFSTLFGLKLGELVFGASETLSKSLQGKDTTIQEAIAAVKLAKCFYTQQRRDGPFLVFYDDVVKVAQKYNISAPQLPHYRRIPKRLDDGIEGHRYATPQDYFRHQYFQALDLLIAGLDDRFDQSEVLGPVLDLENLLLKSANGANFNVHLASLKSSYYKDDCNWEQLNIQLLMCGNLVKEALPMVKEVTNIRTICDAMNKSNTYKTMLPEVHKLLYVLKFEHNIFILCLYGVVALRIL